MKARVAGALVVTAILVVGGFALSFPALLSLLHSEPACSAPATVTAPPTVVDEQLALAETAASSGLAFNISATVQADANGYGPAYLVNGLTDQGDWFQAGIAYDWMCGNGYAAGFSFVYEVWAPGGKQLEHGLENTTIHD